MEWFKKNYDKLKVICKKVSKQNEVDELLHFCIDQVITNDKFNGIEDEKQKFFYFTRVVSNNFNSNTSPFHTTYRNQKIIPLEYHEIMDIQEEESIIDIEWVKREIEEIKKDEWYYGRLFELYIEEDCNLTKLNKRTTIPLGPLSRDINKVRRKLIQKRQKLYGL